jgi:hypothetical protein
MNSYFLILIYLGLAELLRRFVSALILAFTGPLSKIPGPLLWKLTPLPWLYECLTGNMMNVAPGLFEKYGDVVRVGKYLNCYREASGLMDVKLPKMYCSPIKLELSRSLSMMIWSRLLCIDRFRRMQKSLVLFPREIKLCTKRRYEFLPK